VSLNASPAPLASPPRAGGPKRGGRRQTALWLALALHACAPLAAEPVAVAVTNASEPTLCAERDNVTLNLASREVRRFRIEAAHPAYIGALGRDNFEADWSGCTAPEGPAASSSGTLSQPPKRTTLYEDIDWWVVGLTFASFWRPASASVRIGDRIERGLHLLQVWRIRPMGGEEVLVLYPQDGYWRLRPLAPPGLAPTAFGSSFLIGPVEAAERPIVKIKEVSFEPKTRSFTLAFERGGSALVRMAAADQKRSVLEVAFAQSIDGQPFAALRSMFVSELINDAARIAVREKGAKAWREDAILRFTHATATNLWVGRLNPSRHNSSAPELVFDGFSSATAAQNP